MSRLLRAFLPQTYLELWNPNTSPGPIGGIGSGGGGGGAGSSGSGSSGGGSSQSGSAVLSLHDASKPLGRILQLGQPARAELENTQRNTVVNTAKPAQGIRRPSPHGTGSNNTPIAFFGGGALEGRGGPSAT